MDLRGVFAPIPTPFDANEEVDHPALTRALARWVASPLAGFVVLGTSGEAVLLDETEGERVLETARKAIPAGRTLIAGTGRESTRSAIHAAKRAASLGADALLVRTPAFYKDQLTTDAFVHHYTAVADASPIPVILYNFTAVTGVNLGPDAVARLASHANIAGMKESERDAGRIAQLVAAVPPGFPILAGSASTFYPSLCAGAAGAILALACVLPDACVQILKLVRDGQHDAAAKLQGRVTPLARLIGTHGVPGLKEALAVLGYPVGRPRSPLAQAGPSERAAFKEALAAFEEVSA